MIFQSQKKGEQSFKKKEEIPIVTQETRKDETIGSTNIIFTAINTVCCVGRVEIQIEIYKGQYTDSIV